MLTLISAYKQIQKTWTLRLGLALIWTSLLGLGQFESFVVWDCWKNVLNDMQMLKTEFKFKTTITLTQIANPNLCIHANIENVNFTVRVRVKLNLAVRVRAVWIFCGLELLKECLKWFVIVRNSIWIKNDLNPNPKC